MGAPAPKLSPVPYPLLWATGLIVPLVRELRATRYQFVSPFVIDSSVTEQTFGLAPTDLDTALGSISVAHALAPIFQQAPAAPRP
jgi:hypothetical protein